jgi:peptidoglycan hydrolase CwlO-like protein
MNPAPAKGAVKNLEQTLGDMIKAIDALTERYLLTQTMLDSMQSSITLLREEVRELSHDVRSQDESLEESSFVDMLDRV